MDRRYSLAQLLIFGNSLTRDCYGPEHCNGTLSDFSNFRGAICPEPVSWFLETGSSVMRFLNCSPLWNDCCICHSLLCKPEMCGAFFSFEINIGISYRVVNFFFKILIFLGKSLYSQLAGMECVCLMYWAKCRFTTIMKYWSDVEDAIKVSFVARKIHVWLCRKFLLCPWENFSNSWRV